MDPTARRLSSSTRSVPDWQLVAAVYREVESSFTRECPRRYGAHVTLSRPEENRTEGEVRLNIRLEPPDLTVLEARLIVRHLGDNVYKVVCTIDEDGSQRWAFALPKQGGTTERQTSDPSLESYIPSYELVKFLLEALEKRLGHLLLQSAKATAIVGEMTLHD